VTAEPLRGEGGRTRGWLVVVADRTELDRRAAQERLAEGLAQLGELSAGVAHELRNSLASLSGWLALARRAHRARGATGAPDPRAAPPSADLDGCLDEAERETSQLARVVEDFLAFARPGTRRLEAVDLAALAARAAHDPALGDVSVALDLAREASFEGDAGLLERALRNLVANAAEAERSVGRRGPVAISLASVGGDWRIAVEDRGPGLPEAVRARLFEPFASGRPGGAGLGLALARRIVLLHGGSIRLEPRAGGGTTAEIRLPRGGFVTDRNGPGPVAKP
jgi:signal transduction histidine kinase